MVLDRAERCLVDWTLAIVGLSLGDGNGKGDDQNGLDDRAHDDLEVDGEPELLRTAVGEAREARSLELFAVVDHPPIPMEDPNADQQVRSRCNA